MIDAHKVSTASHHLDRFPATKQPHRGWLAATEPKTSSAHMSLVPASGRARMPRPPPYAQSNHFEQKEQQRGRPVVLCYMMWYE